MHVKDRHDHVANHRPANSVHGQLPYLANFLHPKKVALMPRGPYRLYDPITDDSLTCTNTLQIPHSADV